MTDAQLIGYLRGRSPDPGEPMAYAVIHPDTCREIADRLESRAALLQACQLAEPQVAGLIKTLAEGRGFTEEGARMMADASGVVVLMRKALEMATA